MFRQLGRPNPPSASAPSPPPPYSARHVMNLPREATGPEPLPSAAPTQGVTHSTGLRRVSLTFGVTGTLVTDRARPPLEITTSLMTVLIDQGTHPIVAKLLCALLAAEHSLRKVSSGQRPQYYFNLNRTINFLIELQEPLLIPCTLTPVDGLYLTRSGFSYVQINGEVIDNQDSGPQDGLLSSKGFGEVLFHHKLGVVKEDGKVFLTSL